MNDMMNAPENKNNGRRYLGSIDILTAQNWASECGHAVGTKPWQEYAKKKLKSGDYGKYLADQSVHRSQF